MVRAPSTLLITLRLLARRPTPVAVDQSNGQDPNNVCLGTLVQYLEPEMREESACLCELKDEEGVHHEASAVAARATGAAARSTGSSSSTLHSRTPRQRSTHASEFPPAATALLGSCVATALSVVSGPWRPWPLWSSTTGCPTRTRRSRTWCQVY